MDVIICQAYERQTQRWRRIRKRRMCHIMWYNKCWGTEWPENCPEWQTNQGNAAIKIRMCIIYMKGAVWLNSGAHWHIYFDLQPPRLTDCCSIVYNECLYQSCLQRAWSKTNLKGGVENYWGLAVKKVFGKYKTVVLVVAASFSDSFRQKMVRLQGGQQEESLWGKLEELSR